MNNTCPICGSSVNKGTTTFTVDFKIGVIVARNVPAKVCDQCGESWLDDVIAARLEEYVNEAKKNGKQLEMIDYSNLLAA